MLKIVSRSQGKTTKDKEKKTYKNNQKTMNKMSINTYLTITTLNLNN